MKLFGHPLHLMFIHFPSALFPMECVCYALFYCTANTSFGFASFYAMTGGVLLGWVAIMFGAFDLAKIDPGKTKVTTKALIHGSINTTVVLVYSVFTWMLYKRYPALPDALDLLLVLKIVLVIFMIGGNFLGGSLVLKDKVGIEK